MTQTHDTIDEYLRFLHGSLDPGEEIYLAPADNPRACQPVDTLDQAVALACEWQERGCFISTGTFAAGQARDREHLLSVPAIMLDADLKLALTADGMDEDAADAKIRACAPAVLEKLCVKHRQTITDTLARVGLAPSALVFSGGGHQVILTIDFLDQRDTARIETVYKRLVAALNAVNGWELFEKEVNDAGTRYLRCPGTANVKSDPPRRAAIVQNAGPTYTLDELEASIRQQSTASSDEDTANADPSAEATEEAQTSGNAITRVANILLPYWKKGQRHTLAVGLSGYLAKAEWSWTQAKACLREIASLAEDEEIKSRLTDGKGTYAKYKKEKDLIGYTALCEILNEEDLQRLEDAVGTGEMPIEEEEGETAGQTKIKWSADLTRMVNQAEAAILKLPGPVLYQRARQLVRIAPAGEGVKWLKRAPEAPTITATGADALLELTSQAARWFKYDKREEQWVRIIPGSVIAKTLAARVTWQFPRLEGLVNAPTIRPDGKLLQTPGYDEETKLYLDFAGVQFPPIPETPTHADAVDALDILYQPFADFPFKEDCHKSAALAGTMTPLVRFAIARCTPLFAVRAHAPRSGKGLLINTSSMIATGRAAPVWQQTANDEEERKRLISIALAGDQIVHIDNITQPFGSGPLDSAITAEDVFSDRLLSKNETVAAPWRAVLFASGNNLVFKSDMAWRVVLIDLDAKTEHPEQRSDFAHPRLLDYVRAERPRLVVAALTALKAFFVAGCPKQPNVSEFGGFEEWSDLIRHCLLWCGWPDPLAGRRNIGAESDPTSEKLAELLRCWGVCYPDEVARTLKVIIQDATYRRELDPKPPITPPNEWNDLYDALSAYDAKFDGKRLNAQRIGIALKSIDGRIIGDARIVRGADSYNVATWKREGVK
jgi:hypothetical protein